MSENQMQPRKKSLYDNLLNLTSFPHQAGGHTLMLKDQSSSYYVYKPYQRKEAEFYELINKLENNRVKEIVPEYFGITSCSQDKLESISIEDFFEIQPSTTHISLKKRANSETISLEKHEFQDDQSDKKKWLCDLYSCRFNKNNNKFLKLKDLTYNYENPCILDIKVGSRAYNSNKKDHQEKKMQKSTSFSLGFRICGMQIQRQNGKELFYDKYWGRKINPDDMPQALALFFRGDSNKVQKHLIDNYLDKLRKVIEIIGEAKGFRFYSSSLLLVYDNNCQDDLRIAKFKKNPTQEKEESHPEELSLNKKWRSSTEYFKISKQDLAIIDFGQFHYDEELNTPDTDFIEGLKGFMAQLEYLLEHPNTPIYHQNLKIPQKSSFSFMKIRENQELENTDSKSQE